MKNGTNTPKDLNAPSPENVAAYEMGPSGSQPLIKKDVDSSKLITEEAREILQHGFDKDQVAGNLAQLNQRTKLLPSMRLVLDEVKKEMKDIKERLNAIEEEHRETKTYVAQFAEAERGVNRAITNSCNEQARMRKKNREGFEDTQQMVLLKGEDVIEEVQYLSTAVNKLQALLICQDDQIQ